MALILEAARGARVVFTEPRARELCLDENDHTHTVFAANGSQARTSCSFGQKTSAELPPRRFPLHFVLCLVHIRSCASALDFASASVAAAAAALLLVRGVRGDCVVRIGVAREARHQGGCLRLAGKGAIQIEHLERRQRATVERSS